MPRFNQISTVALLALAACHSGSDGDQHNDPAPTGGQVDPTSPTGTTGGTGTVSVIPTVVSTSPVDGATDVMPDDVITISFSHVMDPASVEAVLYSAALSSGYTTDWDANFMQLTIIPDEPMPMAEGRGNDPSEVVGNYFEIVVGGAAMNEDGVAMGEGFAVGFHTYKRMTTSFSVDPQLTGHVDGDRWDVSAPGDLLRVGDVPSNDGTRALVTFDLSELPAEADIIEMATWTARHTDNYGNADTIDPYTQAYHVSFDELGQEACFVFPLSVVGPFSTWDSTSIAKDVTLAVQDDLDNRAARGSLSQYRIQFDSETNRDDNLDYYAYDPAAMALTMTYLSR